MDSELLKQLQITEFNMLCDIDMYCRENGIKYSIYAGTMLGAVRHKGFIPWDDDVDIAMTRTEYSKFCRIFNENPMDGYYLENYELDKHCEVCHGKIRKLNTLLLQDVNIENIGHHEIWIDIFPLDKIPLDSHGEKIKRIGRQNVIITRVNNKRKNDSIITKTAKLLIKIIPYRLRKKILIRNTRYLESNSENVTDNYSWISMSTLDNIKKIRFPMELCNSYTDLEFDDHYFMSFANYKEMLSLIYGDYLKLPPETERICRHNPVKIKL